VAVAVTSPLTLIASDAYWQGDTGHPRTTGTFARVLGRYVRETNALSLMDAIRKMTLMPAQRLEARVPRCGRKDGWVSAPTRISRSSILRRPGSLDVPRTVAVACRHSARDRERRVSGRERAGSRGRRARNSGRGEAPR